MRLLVGVALGCLGSEGCLPRHWAAQRWCKGLALLPAGFDSEAGQLGFRLTSLAIQLEAASPLTRISWHSGHW